MSLLKWNAQKVERYREQFELGLHDTSCEQRERSSLCHCSKRRREAEGKTEFPEIYFPPPYCGGCDQDVEFDGDGFACPRCKVSWDRNVTEGDKADEWTDDFGDDIGGEQFGERLLALINQEMS